MTKEPNVPDTTPISVDEAIRIARLPLPTFTIQPVQRWAGVSFDEDPSMRRHRAGDWNDVYNDY